MKKLLIVISVLMVVLLAFAVWDYSTSKAMPDSNEHIHKIEIIPKVPASCTETGLTEGQKCSECDEVVVAQEIIPTAGHAFDSVTSTTCNQCGYIREVLLYDGSKVTITFYHTMGTPTSKLLDVYITEFNKLYPNITIEHTNVGGYDDVYNQIKSDISAGKQPNMAYCYPDHVASYNSAYAVAPLDKYINDEVVGFSEEDKNNFIAGFYDEGAQFGDGQMYMLPFSKSTDVLYYNKTFFDQYGLKVPTTWDEMEDVCEAILKIDPDCVPLGVDSEANLFINMCAQLDSPYTSATGDHYLFDNQINRDFVRSFSEWYDKGYLTTLNIYGKYTSYLFTSQETNNCYMSLASSAGATHYRPDKDSNGFLFEVGIAPIPQANPTNPKVSFKGPSLCMFNSTNPQEMHATWLFMQFLTTNVELQAEFAFTSGYMPVVTSVSYNSVYQDYLAKADGGNNISALAQKVCWEQEKAYFALPAFVGTSVAYDQVGDLMVRCLTIDNSGDIAAVIKKEFEKALVECLSGN